MSQFPVSPRNPEIYTSVVARRNVQTLSDVKKQVGPSLTIPRGVLFQRLCWFEERPFLRRVPFADDSKNVMSFASATTGTSELSSRGFLFPLKGMFLPTIELEEKKIPKVNFWCPSPHVTSNCSFSKVLIEYKINKTHRCHVKHREQSQYLVRTFKWSIICKSTTSFCCTPETLTL